METGGVGISDALLAELLENAASVGMYHRSDVSELESARAAIRSAMRADDLIVVADVSVPPLPEVYVVDGAHATEVDRSTGHSVSCAVLLGSPREDFMQCIAALPRVTGLSALSSGLMFMQEVMMAVSCVERSETAVCVIDGSKASAVIHINQFYESVDRSQIEVWRRAYRADPAKEPGRTLAQFEGEDWLRPFLVEGRILGNVKMVTTTRLVEKYARPFLHRFDDKALADVVLEPGEILVPVAYEKRYAPEPPDHMSEVFPHHKEVKETLKEIVSEGPSRLHHMYYRPLLSLGAYKIEVNGSMAFNQSDRRRLLSWWRGEVESSDIEEPYALYVADRFCKDAVRVAREAMIEATRGNPTLGETARLLSAAYRT